VSGLVVIMKRASSMSRDEVVAFLRSNPAVDSGSNSGGRTLLAERSSRLRTSATTDQRNAATAKLSPSLYSTISTALWWLEERPWLGCDRPLYVCWPPLKPGLSALQS
jgi:hypothetical protein